MQFDIDTMSLLRLTVNRNIIFSPSASTFDPVNARFSRSSLKWINASLAVLFLLTDLAHAWTPGVSNPTAASNFSVNRYDKRDVLAFYQVVYKASNNFVANLAWTGNITTGQPGTTSSAFKNDVLRRVNFYRALSGLPADVVLNDAKSAKCQEAALMFARNDSIQHDPPSNWTFYTPNAAEAASNSSIGLGTYGPSIIDGYVRDDGAQNTPVGHRRWLLYSRCKEIGTGDVPPVGNFQAANSTWMLGDFKSSSVKQFNAWPNEGYVPHDLVPSRWSLSYPNAQFDNATVTMSRGGVPITVNVISKDYVGFGENTIIWEPAGIPSTVTQDVSYEIEVSGITGKDVPTSYRYNVTIFNPELLGETPVITGTATPPTTGATYSFNSINQADAYLLEISSGNTATWKETAEDSVTQKVTATINSLYSLRQTWLKNNGSKAFQLTFASDSDVGWDDQIIVIDRVLLPTSNSTLTFSELFRWVTTTSRLSAEVSDDEGATWFEVWGRDGNGNSSSKGWDTSFNSRSIGLSSYAGRPIQVRFRFHNSGTVFTGVGKNYGVFIDDISVTNATELVNTKVTRLEGNAKEFELNESTAGQPLSNGSTYYMRVRPSVGLKLFPFGPLKRVGAPALSALASLSDLQVSSGSLTPAFDGETLNYSMRVPNSVDSLDLTAVLFDSNASLKINDTAQVDAKQRTIALNTGSNQIRIQVMAQNNINQRTYVLQVQRSAATDANLQSLIISSGSFDKAFSPNQVLYQVNVPFETQSLTLIPSTSASAATVKVNGNTVASGQASGSIPINAGTNSITITVTSEDASTVKNYLITVTKAEFTRIGETYVRDLKSLLSSSSAQSYQLIGKLPKGLTFNSLTGQLSGITTGPVGSYALTLQALSNGIVSQSTNLTLIISPFPPTLLGSYEALMENSEARPSGALRLTISNNNVWIASLEMPGYAIRRMTGKFDLNPNQNSIAITATFAATATLPRCVLNLNLSDNAPLFSGTYTSDTSTGTLQGFRLANASQSPTKNTPFVLSLDGGVQTNIAVPSGIGFATGVMSNKGTATLRGVLGDAQPFTTTLRLSATGQALVWIQPYRNKNSFLGGIISLDRLGQTLPVPNTEKWMDRLRWYRSPDSSELAYTSGFGPIAVMGSHAAWSAPSTASVLTTLLNLRDAQKLGVVMDGAEFSNVANRATIGFGDLPTQFAISDRYSLTASAPVSSSPAKWTGSISRTTGAVSGSIRLPYGINDILAGTAVVQGVMLPNDASSQMVGGGLIKIPVIGKKGAYRTSAFILQR